MPYRPPFSHYLGPASSVSQRCAQRASYGRTLTPKIAGFTQILADLHTAIKLYPDALINFNSNIWPNSSASSKFNLETGASVEVTRVSLWALASRLGLLTDKNPKRNELLKAFFTPRNSLHLWIVADTCFAQRLGFKTRDDLALWAYSHPEIWGNSRGHELFYSVEAWLETGSQAWHKYREGELYQWDLREIYRWFSLVTARLLDYYTRNGQNETSAEEYAQSSQSSESSQKGTA